MGGKLQRNPYSRNSYYVVPFEQCAAHPRGAPTGELWMFTVWTDADLARPEGRDKLYRGGVFVLSPRPSLAALIDHARSFIEDAFAPLDPRHAQHELPIEQF